MNSLRGIILLGLLALASPIVNAGQTALYLNSTDGDPIGEGVEYYYTSQDLKFDVRPNVYNGISVTAWRFLSGDGIWWFMDFAAAGNYRLATGTYLNATLFPGSVSLGTNGISIRGLTQTCTDAYGSFDVLEVEYDQYNRPSRLAVDFIQFCGANNFSPLTGSLRVNSDIPIPNLSMPSITLKAPINDEQCVEATGPEGARVELLGRMSNDTGNHTYTWSTNTGLSGAGNDFAVDIDLDETQVVSLTATDIVTGEKKIVTRKVCVSDTTAPSITILNPVEGEAFVGNDLTLEVRINDVANPNISDYEFFVGHAGTSSLDALGEDSLRMSRPGEVGTSYESSITVTATDASGNEGSETVNFTVQHDFRPQ